MPLITAGGGGSSSFPITRDGRRTGVRRSCRRTPSGRQSAEDLQRGPGRRDRPLGVAAAEERRVDEQRVKLVERQPPAPARAKRRDFVVTRQDVVEVRRPEE